MRVEAFERGQKIAVGGVGQEKIGKQAESNHRPNDLESFALPTELCLLYESYINVFAS